MTTVKKGDYIKVINSSYYVQHGLQKDRSYKVKNVEHNGVFISEYGYMILKSDCEKA